MKTIHLACQYFLNYDLDENELRRQIKMLADSGYESIFGHARQGLITPYFSKKYWDCIRVIVDECHKNNICFAIWDEDCFPSGVAGNRILWERPDLSVKHLTFSIFEAKKGERVYRILPEQGHVIGCFSVTGENIDSIDGAWGTIRGDVSWRKLLHSGYSPTRKIPMPHWRDGWRGRRVAIDCTAESDCKIVAVQLVNYTNRPDVPNCTDLMNPQTTEEFIKLTHDEYVKQCGQELFNETFDASFLDEPNPGFFYCWSTYFAEEFQKMHGFDLLPYLPHLALDINDQTLFIRHCYRMTQQKLITENYLGQLQKWCHDHHIISTGHLSRSESLTSSNGSSWPNEMKCYSFLDIPCTDPLGAGEAWVDACAYHTGIKVVQSAALIYGKSQAGADTLAVLGHEATIRDLAFHLDYQMTLGLTYFNIHGLSYSLSGGRKDEVPPSIFYQHSQWPWMKDFLKRTGKIADIVNSGKLHCKTAMLYPAATFYCATSTSRDLSWEESIHDQVEKMLSHQKDFIFIDEDAVCNMIDTDPAKLIKDYPYFVIPDLRYLPRTTALALEKYAACGGTLLVTGKLPQLFGPTLDDPAEVWSNGEKFRCDTWLESLPGPDVTGCGARDILLQQRIIDGKLLTIFFNRAEIPFNGKFNDQDIYLAPGCATLMYEGEKLTPPGSGMTQIAELDHWDLTFPLNHLALPCWDIPGDIIWGEPHVQLMERKLPDVSEVKDLYYEMKFLYSGTCDKLEFILEKDDLAGGFRCLVNDVEITGFKPANFSDICFVSADISHAVITGNSPRLNKIRIIPLNGGELLETPFLQGRFQAEYRHSGKTMPVLHGFDGNMKSQKLQLWSAYGYGNFSGSAVYKHDIEIAQSGTYILDLGQVEELAEVMIDGRSAGTLFQKPYVTGKFYLSSGLHTITVTVANGPGNRDRLAALPSGMIGPVKLLKE